MYSTMGVLIGFVVNAVFMPLLLTTEQVGLLSFLGSLSSVFSGLFALGFSLVILNIYPKYPKKHIDGFYTVILIISAIGIGLSIITYFGGQSIFLQDKNEASDYTYFSLGFILICTSRILFRNNDSLIKMTKNTVLGTVLESLVVKIIILAALIYYYLSAHKSFDLLFFLYVFALSFPGLVSQLYLWFKGIRISNLKKAIYKFKPFKKEVLSLAGFGILNALGLPIVMEVDRIMVSNTLGLGDNAVYSIAFLFGAFVSLPAKGIKRISAVFVSNAWNENKLDTIADLYRKSCINLGVVGTYLLLGVWLNIDAVFSFLPETYAEGKYVVLLIGFSHLIDMTFGINNEILATSPYYRYTTYFMGLLIVLVIGLNALLIPAYGINGAAFASFLALISVNIFRFIFLFKTYGFQPFTWKIILLSAISASFFLLPMALPKIENVYLDIAVTSLVLTVGYWSIVYISKISTDINELITKTLSRIFGR